MNNHRQMLPAALALAVSCAVHSEVSAAGVLYPDASQNANLANGDYVFAGAHSANDAFLDEFQFSLAAAGNITANVSNAMIDQPSAVAPGLNLFDNRLLTISLFDSGGHFITAAGAGGTLSATGLSSGNTYTLAISGKATGVFGGVYNGELNVDTPAVPLPPALPGFAAALATLGLRRRKDTSRLA